MLFALKLEALPDLLGPETALPLLGLPFLLAGLDGSLLLPPLFQSSSASTRQVHNYSWPILSMLYSRALRLVVQS